jgi:amidohydrolase
VSGRAFSLVEGAVRARSALVAEIALALYADPEPSLQEHRAARLLSGLLESGGFSVRRGLAGLETSFVAEMDTGRPGPSFALIAEYDALPGVGHGCGHNLIAASAVAAALSLAEISLRLCGRLLVFGTPAEEAYGGKAAMISAGLFAGVDESVMLHPESASMVAADALACESFRFAFKGKAAHAACFPYKGINALDAVLLGFNAVSAMRQQLKDDVRVHGIVTKGGTAVNVIPDDCEAAFLVRSRTASGLEEAREKVVACFRGAAVATGASLEILQDDLPNLDMVNDPELTMLLEEELARAGFADIGRGDPFPGSTDYGNVSHALRASYGFYDLGARGPELHSREFADFTVTPLALERTVCAAVALAAVAASRLLPGVSPRD